MDENNKPDQAAAGETPDDEPILDLTDEVRDESANAEESTASDEAVAEPLAEDETDFDADPLAATVELEDALEDDLGFQDDEEDDFVGSMGMEIDDDEEDEEASDSGGIDVADEQLDAALERVIRKMFYDKIDRILVEVVEKTVTREIERLKRTLLEDASGD
jgi:hypothetical protein